MLKLIAIKQKADYRQREREKESQNKTKIFIKNKIHLNREENFLLSLFS